MASIYPGGTPLHQFTVPFPAASINKAIVSYFQGGLVLEKTVTQFDDAENDSAYFAYRLTQAESLKFRDNSQCSMQVNILFNDGTRSPSQTWLVKCETQHHKEVIS